MSALKPMYLKQVVAEDPIFENTKVVYQFITKRLKETLVMRCLKNQELQVFMKKTLLLLMMQVSLNLHKIAINFSDAVIIGSEKLAELESYIQKSDKQTLDYQPEDAYIASYNEFYDELRKRK